VLKLRFFREALKEEVTMEEPFWEKRWVQILLVVIILGLFAGLAWYYFSLYDRFNQENLRDFVLMFGAWAPLAYAVVYIISAPIPFLAPVISAVGGLLFGTLWGLLLVMASATVSSLIPFYLARKLGRDWVEEQVKGKRLDEFLERSEGKKAFPFIMLMRLIPVLPWEVQNYAAGLTRVPVLTYLAATAVGIIPGSFSLVFLGAAASDPTSWEFVAAIAFKIVVALVPVIVIYIRHRRNKDNETDAENESDDQERAE
jgi:uncharacterized membrane protein YdjX (TVP38/TMEM64 family)